MPVRKATSKHIAQQYVSPLRGLHSRQTRSSRIAMLSPHEKDAPKAIKEELLLNGTALRRSCCKPLNGVWTIGMMPSMTKRRLKKTRVHDGTTQTINPGLSDKGCMFSEYILAFLATEGSSQQLSTVRAGAYWARWKRVWLWSIPVQKWIHQQLQRRTDHVWQV